MQQWTKRRKVSGTCRENKCQFSMADYIFLYSIQPANPNSFLFIPVYVWNLQSVSSSRNPGLPRSKWERNGVLFATHQHCVHGNSSRRHLNRQCWVGVKLWKSLLLNVILPDSHQSKDSGLCGVRTWFFKSLGQNGGQLPSKWRFLWSLFCTPIV